MTVAGLQETLTVTGEAPLIEVTQSKVASSIEATELQNLPMIARNVSGMLALLPGAVQIEPTHRSKTNVGQRVVRRLRWHERHSERGRRRQPRQPVRRAAARLLDGGGRAVPAGDQPVQRGRRPHRRRCAADGHQVGHERVQRVRCSGSDAATSLPAKDFFTKEANRDKDPYRPRSSSAASVGGPDPAQPRVLLRRRRADS